MQFSALKTQLRERLGEPSATAWSDTELGTWINEAVRDISTRAECNQYLIELNVDQDEYLIGFPPAVGTLIRPDGASTFSSNLTYSVGRIWRMTWIDNADQDTWTDEQKSTPDRYLEYPLRYSSISGLDSVRGAGQQTNSGRPEFYSLWGQPGNMKIVLYPRPHADGNLRVYFYGIPPEMSGDSDTDGLPIGWESLILDYAEFRAKVRDQNPNWQVAKQDYESRLDTFRMQFKRLTDHNEPIEVDPYFYDDATGWY